MYYAAISFYNGLLLTTLKLEIIYLSSFMLSFIDIFVKDIFMHYNEYPYSLLEASFFQYFMTRIAKIIEVVGSSDKGWQDAAQSCIR